MSPLPEITEPKTAWEWATGAVFVLLAGAAGAIRWLRSGSGSGARKSDRPATMEPSQIDRIEELLKMLCRALTIQNEDGYPVSSSRKLADRLAEKLDRIEKRLDGIEQGLHTRGRRQGGSVE